MCKYEQKQLHFSFLTLNLFKKNKNSEYCHQSVNDLSLLVIIQTYLNTARGRLTFQTADPDQIFWRRLIGESEIETIISEDIWLSDTEASRVDLKC